MDIGPSELIIVLVIVLLLFGPGRIANIGGELGKAVGEFRKGLAKGADHNEPVVAKVDVPPAATSTSDTVS